MINIRPTSKGALCRVSTLVLGWVSAFGQPYGPCPQADTQPNTRTDTRPRNTRIDTRPRNPFTAGLMYLFTNKFVRLYHREKDLPLITYGSESDRCVCVGGGGGGL